MLPELLKITVTPEDAREAVCGSPTQCTIAKALKRQLPQAEYIKVHANRITITADDYYHHYSMPNAGLKIVAETDAGVFRLTNNIKLGLYLQGAPTKKVRHTPERQVRINTTRAKRAAEGRPDKTYAPNPRLLAAKREGIAMKKLDRVQAQRAA